VVAVEQQLAAPLEQGLMVVGMALALGLVLLALQTRAVVEVVVELLLDKATEVQA
jgi:hypothetical protein